MATRPNPLDMPGRGQDFLRHVPAIAKPAPAQLARIGWIVVAVERLADHRADAVGADHELGLDLSSVRKIENDTLALLVDCCEAMSEMNGAVIEVACERVQQVGAVKGVIWS